MKNDGDQHHGETKNHLVGHLLQLSSLCDTQARGIFSSDNKEGATSVGLESNLGFKDSVLSVRISLFYILVYHVALQDPDLDMRDLSRLHDHSLLQLCHPYNQILGLIFCTVLKTTTERRASL